MVPAACVLAGPGPGPAEAAAPVKTAARTTGPPWELHDARGDDDMVLLRAQESEVKALYHEIHRARSVLAGDLYVSDSQGARYVWNRSAFRWEPVLAVLPQPRLKTPQLL